MRTTSIATVPDSALTTADDSRLVVAGGGYGGNGVGGCNNQGGNGGTAGDTTVTGPGSGGNGTIVCSGESFSGGDSGLGGTAGGAGGAGGTPAGPTCTASSGSLGQGGDSLYPPSECGGWAGGGGGGYYGGGAGGVDGESAADIFGGGGGAGSSYWVPGATGTSMSENQADMPAQVQVTPVIAAVATSTSVASSANPSVSGQQVTFTATVTAVQGTATSAGTVQFSIDGSPAGGAVTLDGSGQATYTTPALSVTGGTGHTVTADYVPGSGSFAASSGSLPGGQQVGKAATATTLQSSANPSAAGQDITFTATVSASPPGTGTPTGQVTFYADGAPIGSGTLDASGSATAETSSLPAGPHTITAAYGGHGDFAGSTSAALTQAVGKAPTSTTVASSANPAIPRQPVTYTATVRPADGGGTVAFDDRGKPVTGCTARHLDSKGQATCHVTYTGAGSHTITAAYSGDTAYAGSVSAALTQRVVPDKANLQVKLSVPAKAPDGASVTETVTVTNQGPATATTVITTLTEPGGLTVTNAGGAMAKGRVLTWSTASLAPGANLTFTVTAQVGPHAHGTVLVAARTRSATPDPDLASNAAVSPLQLG